MEDSIKFTLNDFGVIDNAKINIGKITVVGGKNASCKSTISKLLFAFLKYNSSNRKELVYEDIIAQMTRFLLKFNDYSNNVGFEFPMSDLIEFLSKFNDDKIEFESKLNSYQSLKEIYRSFDFNDSISAELDDMINEIDNLIEIVDIDNSSLYNSIMRKLLKSEFSTTKFNGFSKLQGVFKEIPYEFSVNFTESDFNSDNSFKHKGLFSLNDVFYIDSFSILDINDDYGLQSADHCNFLAKNIKPNANESNELFDEKRYKKLIHIEKQIQSLIDGEIKYEGGNLLYISDSGEQFFMKNTASGIKQIGIIQLLLSYRKLKENSFLIMDEPEVNLHPEWQFKLANILVLLAKSLNISVYINSHSPLFIESLYTFAHYYDISDDITYHLAEISEDSGLYNICEVEENNLSKIYDDLGKPYFDMDVLMIEKELD